MLLYVRMVKYSVSMLDFHLDHSFLPIIYLLGNLIVKLTISSHGHADHIGAIAQHMKKRALNNLGTATYFMPKHLVPHVKTICDAFTVMSEKVDSDFVGTFVPVEPGNKYEVCCAYIIYMWFCTFSVIE